MAKINFDSGTGDPNKAKYFRVDTNINIYYCDQKVGKIFGVSGRLWSYKQGKKRAQAKAMLSANFRISGVSNRFTDQRTGRLIKKKHGLTDFMNAKWITNFFNFEFCLLSSKYRSSWKLNLVV